MGTEIWAVAMRWWILKIVHAIPFIVTCAVVIGLTNYEYKSPCPDVAQTALSYLGVNYSGAYLHHHSRSVNAEAYFLTLEHHKLGIESKSVATTVGQWLSLFLGLIWSATINPFSSSLISQLLKQKCVLMDAKTFFTWKEQFKANV